MTINQKSSSNLAAVKDTALTFWQQAEQAHWHSVSGISMWPFLKHGDSVFIQPTSGAFRVGDVVLIRFSTRLIIHRVTQIKRGGSIIAWGDFNLHPDPIAMSHQVIGVAQSIKRQKRSIPIGVQRRVWGLLLVYCRPVLMPLLLIMRKLLRIKQLCSRFLAFTKRDISMVESRNRLPK